MPKKKEEDKKKSVIVDTDAITKQVMAYVDSELDKRLEKAVDDSVRKNIIDEIEKANKKVIRMKNRKIFVKNVFLILFFLIIVFLVYLLYSNHYFDSSSKEVKNLLEEKKIVQQEEEVLPTLDELKEKYSSYLDPYVLSEKSMYTESFYEGNLTTELKNYFALMQIDFSQLPVEDDYNVIEASSLKEICSSLFEKCDNGSFDYNGNKVRHFEKLKSYITNSVLEREESSVRREIIDIQEDKKVVRITTLEAVVEGEQIYSVYPFEFVSEYYEEGLSPYSDSLNKVIYTFKNKKLISVEKG
ncbi:MAG: hypothetical protein IKF71_02955 [Bacilli bacterium]|nr:hypothetical protein [Bacilli bacterium]